MSIEDNVLRFGKRYIPAPLPPDLRRMPMGHCFDNCELLALESHGKYRYVEGVARSYRNDVWLLHAWLTDGVHAFDPTWHFKFNDNDQELPFPGDYVGIEMDHWHVAEFMLTTEYAGVLANAWRAIDLAQKALGESAEVIHYQPKRARRRLGIVTER